MQQLSFIEKIPQEISASYENSIEGIRPFNRQLLKWVGNKQRFAWEIINHFPKRFGTYLEPFLGSGGVLATLAPRRAIASDAFPQLIEIFATLQTSPLTLIHWYSERWNKMRGGEKRTVYEEIKASYNAKPNAADLVFISRSCYGGVVRFRNDGYISTPVGVHDPIPPDAFASRVLEWSKRVKNVIFYHSDYRDAMNMAKPRDLIYCDPPYSHSQSILYGAQAFDLEQLIDRIAFCKKHDIYVALSIDGTKKSGNRLCDLPIPEDLFEREIMLNVGRSMLKRFQMEGRTLEGEVVRDRLLLTY